MKKIITLASMFFLCLAVSAGAAEQLPNLVGKWSETLNMHWKNKGFTLGNNKGVFEIEAQEGRLFHGKKSWVTPTGEQKSETFSGAIRADNKSFIIAEHEDGFMFGDILSNDEVMMYYVENGAYPKTMVYEYKRQ